MAGSLHSAFHLSPLLSWLRTVRGFLRSFRAASLFCMRTQGSAKPPPRGLSPALTAHSARPGRTNLFHRFSELKDAGMLSESPLKSRVQNFSLYFCLDRPQYVVVLTDHSLDALSEMR